MMSVVSFDYFPPFEYVDAGFSEVWTDGWSANFEWLGYDSKHFLLGLGSIAVFAALQILTVFVAASLLTCRLKCPCKSVQNTFSQKYAWSGSLTFIHGTFFEVLVCVSVSMVMVPYWDNSERSDQVSIGCAYFFLALLVCYLLFGLYFSCCKARDLAIYNRAEAEERNLERCFFLHDSLAFQAAYIGRQTEE